MASQAENDCLSNPNFAVICSFMDRYGVTLGLPEIGYNDLQEWIEDAKKVHPLLIDLHVRLLRRIHKKLSNVTADRWERGVVKFCYKYSNVDAWEIERFGYKLAKISTKLKLLKNLMESQFDCNNKFKDKVNEIPIEEMRFQPIGRDKDGMAYWYLLDKELNLRVYREHQDDVDSESWELVCRNRDDLAKLITGLETGTGMKLDKQESSDQSEPVSDFNEDSRDSFKQKTPLGPSPLTIKQEPGDGDSTDSKQPIVLKISKSDTQSPSKMLKDKFVKEKGSEIQRIMCKMKEEGLVDSENENEEKGKDDSSKKDEVDGLVDNKEGCEKSLVDECKEDIVKVDKIVKDNIDKADSNTDVKEEQSEVTADIKGKTENSSKDNVNGLQVLEKVKDEIKNEEFEVKSEPEMKDVKEEKHIDTDEAKTEDNRKCSSDKVHSIQNETENHNVIIQNDLQNKDKVDTNCEAIPEKSKEFNGTDQEPEKSTVDSKAEIRKDTIDIPQKDSLSEAVKSAIDDKSESQSNKNDMPEKGESDCTEIKKENLSKITDQIGKSEQNTADVLVENINNDSAISDKENEVKEAEKNDLANDKQGEGIIEVTSAIDTHEPNTESVTLQSNEKSKCTELSESCPSETAEQKDEHSEEKQKTNDEIKETSPKDSEVIEPQDKDNTVVSTNEKPTEDNVVNETGTDNAKKDPETKDSKNDSEPKTKLCKGDTEGNGSEKDSKSNLTEEMTHAKSEKEVVTSEKSDVKKSRKRKNDEIKTESGSSSNEEEVDLESKQPCKRPIKAAVRKSPVKQPDESGTVNDAESNDIEEGKDSDKLDKAKDDSDSNIIKDEVNKSKEDSELKRDSNKVTDPDAEAKVEDKTVIEKDGNTSESQINNQQILTDEKDKDTNKIEEKVEKDVIDQSEKSDCENVSKDKQNTFEVNEKDSTALEEIVDDKSENKSDKNTSEVDEKVESENETGGRPQRKVKGLVAQSKRSKSKAQKRQAENSDDMEPAEPASKRSKLRGRVSSRGRGKRRGVNFDSSSSDDDMPLSQVVGRGRGSNSRGRGRQAVGRQQTKTTKEPAKKKKFEKEEVKASGIEVPDIPSDLSEEDTGRRRSARVRNLRARKKSPSPDYVPSELDVSDDEFFDDDDDDFKLKSKKRKKREPKEIVEEIPKGRNALRHEAKANKKVAKIVEEEEEEVEGEAACVKCLKSHQPEWILLCDKCDAGYHTACLRPPLMIIPDGDWFCPPCEHTSLKDKLAENLKTLDQAILKNDRMVRRKERLAFVSVSLDNVLKEPEPADIKEERPKKKPNYRESDEETGSQSSNGSGSSSSTSESESTSDDEGTHHKKSKQKFVQRACRSKKSVSYRFEEFDELIMDAIEEDLSIPKEPKPRKVKPPGISRGKDMSNILGASDEEETPKKPPRKRKPRLTELDEDIDDDDDTDDYQLSDATNASDATKSSNYESEGVSEDSIESNWRLNARSTRKSRRKGGRSRRYKDDFVVDSDFESEEDSKRRSKRRPRKSKVNYKEINSDETEVEDNEDSFHSSELSDSDFEQKRRKRNDRKKKTESKERPRSGKRQRIRKVLSSSESSEEDSDESGPRKKKGKKPPSKTARYDSDETDEGSEKMNTKKSKGKKLQQLSEKSESGTEETEETDSSETEVSDSDSNKNKKKPKGKNVKKVIKSDSEEEEDQEGDDERKDDSQDTGKESEESGWEEIGVDSDDIVTKSKEESEKDNEKEEQIVNSKPDLATTTELSEADNEKQEQGTEIKDQNESSKSNFEGSQMESDKAETIKDNEKEVESEKCSSSTEVTPQKKKRGRKPKSETINEDSTTPEVTPKKRGRKPKAKPEANEANTDETPIKKKRGRKSKAEKEAEAAGNIVEHVDDQMKADNDLTEEKKTDVSEIKKEVTDVTEDTKALAEQNVDDKNTTDFSQMNEKGKDDSPLSARNKQNAPVGVVKPEVRQGVIVENKQVTDGRLLENRPGESPVNPLQGMRDLALGNQNVQGQHQSSFTPYTQSNYQPQNMQGYIGQPGFQGYQHQAPPYGQSVPGPHHPHQAGPQGMPRGPPPQYPPSQGPMSPNSYQQHGPYMGPMQQGQGFYPGNYRPSGPQGEGFRPQTPHGANPQYYHPHQGQYQGQRHGYPDYPGPYHMGPQGPVQIPPNQQGPGPYPGMPYNYPNMPQGMHRPGFGPSGPQQSMSPNQQIRPQTRVPGPPPPLQRSSPTPRPENDAPNRGFMMDNILKPSPEGVSNDVEDSAEVSDIDRYTSFLCKSTD